MSVQEPYIVNGSSSVDNAQRLEHIIALLEGEGPDAPGLVARVAMIERLLFGKEKEGGVLYRVSIMWRFHVWLLCSLSAGAGFLLRELIRVIWKV